MLRSFLIRVAVGVLLLGCTWAVVRGIRAMSPVPQRVEHVTEPLSVDVQTIHSAPFRPTVVAYGRVRPRRKALVSSRLIGNVSFIHPGLVDGGFVDSGEVVVRLEDERAALQQTAKLGAISALEAESVSLEINRRHTETLLVMARRDLALATVDLQNSERLFAQGRLAEMDLDKKQLREQQYRFSVATYDKALAGIPPEIDGLSAQLRVHRTELLMLLTDMRELSVSPPFSGLVSDRQVDMGERVNPGSPLFVVNDLSRVEILLEVATRDVPYLEMGQRVELSCGDFPEWRGSAVVTRVGSSVGARSGTVTVYADADGEQGISLRENLYVKGRIGGSLLHDRWVLPRHAVQGGSVFLLKDGLARSAPISITYRGEEVFLASGLGEGDSLIVSHLELLYDGCPVSARETLP